MMKFYQMVKTPTLSFFKLKFSVLKALQDISQKSGCELWMQQIHALILKRFLIFTRRYILAIIIIFLPLIMQALICGLIPSGTSIANSITGRINTTGTVDLTILNYKPYTMPYSLVGLASTTSLQNLLKVFYNESNRPGITLEKLANDSVASYVLQKRKDDVKNLVGNYYTGLSFNVTASLIYFKAYYSTLAYHSSASVINEVSNILLAYYSSNNINKTIKTYNSPISSSSLLSGNDLLDVLACIDILPVSLLSLTTSILIGFSISLMVIHVGKERTNGSKRLQMLSGVHYSMYWIANHVFDLIICLFHAASIVSMIKVLDLTRNDTTNEIHSFSDSESLGFLFLLLLFSTFSWTTLAYIWSFLFKSEVVGFVVLVILLTVAALFDMLWGLLEFFLTVAGTKTELIRFFVALRWIFTIIFPNVTIKRAMFDIKLRQNPYCMLVVNTIIGSNYSEIDFPFLLSSFCVYQILKVTINPLRLYIR
jgi:hypothetical protein